MRFSYFIALCLVVSLAGVHWYQTTKYICPVPIEYRLGAIDDSFSISNAEARASIESATQLWESEVGQDLFVYDDGADFVINFVFDDRQATANAQETDRVRLDSIAAQNEEFRGQISQLQSTYEGRQAEFAADKSAYETELVQYNERVRQANDRGGATPDLFAELESQQRTLAATSDILKREAAELNTLAEQLNQLSTDGNRLIETYNQEVRSYNDQYGESHEFTQGDYRGGEINIYKFSTEAELISVLAHEFGHALGIDHIEEPGALMYYLLDDELSATPRLLDSDLEAYTLACTDGGVGAQVRSVIRSVLTKF